MTDTKLQELIDVCKAILASSVQRESGVVPDVEKNLDGLDRVSPNDGSQKERERGIFPAVEPQEIEIVWVMTATELEANHSWDEMMLGKAECLCSTICNSWEDIWGEYYAPDNPELNL